MGTSNILDLEQERLDAMLSADADKLNSLMADDSLYIHSAGGVDTKEVFIDKVRSAELDYKTIGNHIEQLNEVGNIVLITGIIDIALNRSGVPAKVHARYLTVWSGGESPKFVSFQATPLAQ